MPKNSMGKPKVEDCVFTCVCECVKWNEGNMAMQCHRCGRVIGEVPLDTQEGVDEENSIEYMIHAIDNAIKAFRLLHKDMNFRLPEMTIQCLEQTKELLQQKPQKQVTRREFEYIVHDAHCAKDYDACYDALKSWLKELGIEVVDKK